MKELLESAGPRSWSTSPARVHVEEWTEDGIVHLDLEVAPSDRGRVIGRQGRTADALRTVLEAVGRRKGIDCDMEIVD